MKVTKLCDVYIFGVLALEIIKAKHFGEYITLLANSSTSDHVQLSDLLDERISHPENEVKEVLVFIIKLASSCLLETPKSRPIIELANLKNLTELDFSGNQRTGSIPFTLGDLTELKILYLFSNQLSGHIPSELGNLKNLTKLDLSHNQLTGPIPITKLHCINFSDNKFHGELCSNEGKCKNLIDLRVARKPPEIGNVKGLLGLDLSSNHLVGQIPKEIGDLTSLVNLFVQNNNISGSKPGEPGSQTKLESLDLSGNRLIGSIPIFLEDYVHLL
ncbi:probable leucine-rich repeat receptor-like protein kinase At1g35710 [Lycium barbarum]|uniref:probable leucine-rich repeat receptor-like protein kinase At1g35710 n=1 Tax=Lycium barbarum TaxID=112863 RepID=UPI00293E7C26|nr:probable leucine-rich repeat receptor-like protein kinase At1g35710 [Lycium barbarum]